MSVDTVGSLLAGIANSLNDGLRMLMFADKRQWGPDEFEQVRALEEALDEAKRDFQAMSPLVNGQFYYENDRRSESLQELRALNAQFEVHARNFKEWLRTGGPINPTWALETVQLRRDLHRAQCRAACRMFAAGPGATRCLGGYLVRRRQRELEASARRKAQAGLGGGEAEQPMLNPAGASGGPAAGNGVDDLESGLAEPPDPGADEDGDSRRRTSLEALVPDCNAVGRFERFGDRDIAFTCDYCDGFLVWEDLQSMPSTRTPAAAAMTTEGSPGPQTRPQPTASTGASSTLGGVGDFVGLGHPSWQATARSVSTGEEKSIVFAPLAIANHLLPAVGDWRSAVLCPYCDELTYFDDDGGDLELRYAQDERGLRDVSAFQEHLEWYHAGMVMPSMPTKKTNCTVM